MTNLDLALEYMRSNPNSLGINAQLAIKGFARWLDARPAAEPTAECPHCREVYEIWAGIEGFIPATAPEAYQQRIIDQMREAAARGLSVKNRT